MTIFKDEGGGITERSLKYFHSIKPQLGRIVRAEAGFEPLKQETKFGELAGKRYTYVADYNLILYDEVGNEVYLSGMSIGYNGTGPHGSFDVLREVGLLPANIRFEDTAIPNSQKYEWRALCRHYVPENSCVICRGK